MKTILTLAEWNDLMAKALPEEKERLRRERREGLIEIDGLSDQYAATVQRLKRREHWRRGKRGGA